MKKITKFVPLAFTISILCGCTGMGHITYSCVGQSKSAVLKEFGPPERVIPSIENAETWEYSYGAAGGDSVMAYTFMGDKCVKQNSRPHQ